MSKVTQLNSARSGARLPARIYSRAAAPTLSPVERQAAIENALSMALHYVRQPGESATNLLAATARADRAFTLLKQASGS
jgi:hypothetical protein